MISILKQTSQFSDNFGFVKTGRCEKTIISSALMKNENHWPYQMCAHGQSSVHVKGLRWKSILFIQLSQISKVWVFWEGHKIWKNLRHTFDKSVVFCARNSVLVKKLTKIFQNKCGQVVLYKLYPFLLGFCFWPTNF